MTHVCGLRLVLAGALAAALIATPVPRAAADSSAAATARLTALFVGPGVVLRAPENCVSDNADPFSDTAAVSFCAVKDVFGALGGPSSGSAPTDFIKMPNRFEFNQPIDCATVGAVADGKHDGCAVVTGAATLLRSGLPVRLFGMCAKPIAKDCAAIGTITDPTWKADGVYLLMDPAAITVHCQYAQDADRNGCNENAAYAAGQKLPLCSDNPSDRRCQYGPDEQDQMLAAYTGYCTADPTNCVENQLEAQWGPESVIAVGYVNRGDQSFDCASARAKAATFAAAVNATWSTRMPIVQVFLDVARNRVAFLHAATGCEFPT
jgi:hypothetical protein